MIREIRKSELQDLLRLYEHLHRSDAPLPATHVVNSVWAAIQGNPDLKCFGVFVDDVLASSCTLSVIPNLTRGCRPYGIIENVVTAPAFRRKGFGRAVLRHALEHAWSRNCYKVMLLTGSKKEETFRFYESAGFDRQAKQAFVAKPQTAEQGAAPLPSAPQAGPSVGAH
jgi:GNAT superfamily N-acetyltransferase